VSRKYLLNRLGVRRYPIFTKKLSSIISREHKQQIFRDGRGA
jgi:hypothetical protein